MESFEVDQINEKFTLLKEEANPSNIVMNMTQDFFK